MATFNPNITAEKFQTLLENTRCVDIFQDPRWLLASAGKGWTRSQILGLENEQGEVIIAATAYVNSSRGFGSYLYIQHGPLFHQSLLKNPNDNDAQAWGDLNFANEVAQELVVQFFQDLKAYAQQLGYFSLIIEPLAKEASDLSKYLISKNYQPQQWSILPKFPMYIDLTKSEEDLLAAAEKNTRYYVRYAQKQGVEIEFIYPEAGEEKFTSALSSFYSLLGEASEHKGYGLPPLSFFTAAYEVYKNTDNICLVLAKYQGEVISANYTQFFGRWASSYYTANTRRFPKLRASYLLKWATIMEAKRKGKTVFDMWGQIPGLAHNHPEFGYGQFKRSFGPIETTLIGRVILPLNPTKYFLWKLLGRVRYYIKH